MIDKDEREIYSWRLLDKLVPKLTKRHPIYTIHYVIIQWLLRPAVRLYGWAEDKEYGWWD